MVCLSKDVAATTLHASPSVDSATTTDHQHLVLHNGTRSVLIARPSTLAEALEQAGAYFPNLDAPLRLLFYRTGNGLVEIGDSGWNTSWLSPTDGEPIVLEVLERPPSTQHSLDTRQHVKGVLAGKDAESPLTIRPATSGYGENRHSRSDSSRAVDNFCDMTLRPEIFRRIRECGFKDPTILEEQTLVPLIAGCDVVARAPRDTGKTVTIAIALLQLINVDQSVSQALVLAPTRELALKLRAAVLWLGAGIKIKCCAVVGGTPGEEAQVKREIGEGYHIVVGTPEPVMKMVLAGAVETNRLKIVCLEEADQLLSGKFKLQTDALLERLPRRIQMGFFSCTMPPELLQAAAKFANDPVHILVAPDWTLSGLGNLNHFYVPVEKEMDKLERLVYLVKVNEANMANQCARTVIFCNTPQKVEWLTRQLKARNFDVGGTHHEMSESVRDWRLEAIRAVPNPRILVATGRGGHVLVEKDELVINYDAALSVHRYFEHTGDKRYGPIVNLVHVQLLPGLRDLAER
ncbi:hypothetical protein JCM5296_000016 [Sporobolomyces johnsonii]